MAIGENRPSIGRIVHFSSGGNTYAAVITAVKERDCLNLTIINDLTTPFKSHIESTVMVESVYRGNAENEWNWPPLIGTEK